MADAMDSKSISRKGVGVQLPSLAPPSSTSPRAWSEAQIDARDERRARALREVAEELAPALFASLWKRMCRVRLELTETLAALRRDAPRALRDEDLLARQEELREEVRRAGWCLGVLGAAQGADLLRARRERAGLGWLVAAVAEARALELEPEGEALPMLAGPARLALELPLLAAWCAEQAAVRAGRLRWRSTREHGLSRLAFALGEARGRDELAARCAHLNSSRPAPPSVLVADGELALVWL